MVRALKNEKKLKMEITTKNAAGIVRFYCIPDVEYFEEDDVTRMLEKRGTWEKVNQYGQRRLRVEIDHSERISKVRLLHILQECLPLLNPETRAYERDIALTKVIELSGKMFERIGVAYVEPKHRTL